MIPVDGPGDFFLSELQAQKVSLQGSVAALAHTGGTPSINQQKFDWIINATNFRQFTHGMLGKFITYHPCIKLIYAEKRPRAQPLTLTILDGNFLSFEPLLANNANALNTFGGLHLHSFDRTKTLFSLTH